jgi:hypothetical protein
VPQDHDWKNRECEQCVVGHCEVPPRNVLAGCPEWRRDCARVSKPCQGAYPRSGDLRSAFHEKAGWSQADFVFLFIVSFCSASGGFCGGGGSVKSAPFLRGGHGLIAQRSKERRLFCSDAAPLSLPYALGVWAVRSRVHFEILYGALPP